MEALALMDELIDAFHQLRERVTERRRGMRELNADYDTTREEFDAFFDGIEAEIHANRTEALESERALIAVLTPEERILLEKLHTKAMKASIRRISRTGSAALASTRWTLRSTENHDILWYGPFLA